MLMTEMLVLETLAGNDSKLKAIAGKVVSKERITPDEGLYLLIMQAWAF